MDRTKNRIYQYLGLTVALLLAYGWLRDSPWQGSTQLHTLMELVATGLALNVGVLALIRFYTRKNNLFLFLGAGFLGTGLLDFYHTAVTSTFFQDRFPSPPPSLIPWSWVASRLFLALLMYLSHLAWKREHRLGEAGAIPVWVVYLTVTILTLGSFVFFAFVPLPRAYYPALLFHRPEEFVPALFFLLALAGYLKKGQWRRNAFEHWIVLSLIVGVLGQTVFMSFSGRLFDSMFDLAHLLKKVSYVCVLTGLLINMHLLFRREVSSTAEIQGRERRIRAILNNVNDAIITISESRVIETVNPAVEKIFGYSAEEVVGQNVSMLMPEPDRSSHDTYVQNYLSTGIAKIIGSSREVRGRRKDGSTFPLELSIGEFTLGSRRMFTGICRDITERKAQEESLAAGEERFRDFAEATSDWLWEMGPDLRFTWFSPRVEEITGQNVEFHLGKTSEELAGPELDPAKWKTHLADLKARRPFREFGFWRAHPKDGKQQFLSSSGRPFFGKEGEFLGYRGAGSDLTERMEVDRMKSEFISTVSHELRTPLASIVGYTDLLVEGDAGEINENQRDFLEVIAKNSQRLADLIGDLLDVEKLESGRVALALEPVDLYEVLLSVHLTFKVVADQKGLRLNLEAAENLMVNGDRDRLTQVFSNLVSNAIKYTKEGSVGFSVSQTGDAIQVRITDTGIGMAAAVVERLFSKFFRAGDAYTRAAGGTGLGLVIAKAIVLQHGGGIEVATEPGQGSVFTVSLPSLQSGAEPQNG